MPNDLAQLGHKATSFSQSISERMNGVQRSERFHFFLNAELNATRFFGLNAELNGVQKIHWTQIERGVQLNLHHLGVFSKKIVLSLARIQTIYNLKSFSFYNIINSGIDC